MKPYEFIEKYEAIVDKLQDRIAMLKNRMNANRAEKARALEFARVQVEELDTVFARQQVSLPQLEAELVAAQGVLKEKEVSVENKEFVCEDCEKVYKDEKAYEKHILKHKAEKDKAAEEIKKERIRILEEQREKAEKELEDLGGGKPWKPEGDGSSQTETIT